MEDKIITLDVGGTIFKASSSVLTKCGIFKAMLEDVPYEGQTIYIDKCGHVFKHVLGYLRDHRYPYPSKYLYELDYYLIDEGCVNVYSLEGEMYSCIYKECGRWDCVNKYQGDEDYCKEHRNVCSYVLGFGRGTCYCNKPGRDGFCNDHTR